MWVYIVSEMIFICNLPARVLWSILYNYRDSRLIILHEVIIDVSVSMKPFKEKDFVVFLPWRRIEADSYRITYLRLTPPWGLELSSASCMFDLVSPISKFPRRWGSLIRVIRKLRGLSWGDSFNCCLVILIWF